MYRTSQIKNIIYEECIKLLQEQYGQTIGPLSFGTPTQNWLQRVAGYGDYSTRTRGEQTRADAEGTNRESHDHEKKGFSFRDLDENMLYIKRSDEHGDWSKGTPWDEEESEVTPEEEATPEEVTPEEEAPPIADVDAPLTQTELDVLVDFSELDFDDWGTPEVVPLDPAEMIDAAIEVYPDGSYDIDEEMVAQIEAEYQAAIDAYQEPARLKATAEETVRRAEPYDDRLEDVENRFEREYGGDEYAQPKQGGRRFRESVEQPEYIQDRPSWLQLWESFKDTNETIEEERDELEEQ